MASPPFQTSIRLSGQFAAATGRMKPGRIAGLLLFGLLSALRVAPQDVLPQTEILFGSCLFQRRPYPILATIAERRPDLFIFMGDNIYADTINPQIMRREYAKLAANPLYQRLLATCPVLATWDDHDYGANDAGADFPMREDSQQLFLDFWNVPPDSARRARPGIYDSWLIGPAGRQVQILLLDTRYFRDPLQSGSQPATVARGPYVPNPAGTLLGESQWRWLEQELVQPARLRLIVSSIQVIPVESGWEGWANFPAERRRLLELLGRLRVTGVILLSGDRHFAEISRLEREGAYPLYEITSSALNLRFPAAKPNPNQFRLGGYYLEENFGSVEIQWSEIPQLNLRVYDLHGRVRLELKLSLAELGFSERSPRP